MMMDDLPQEEVIAAVDRVVRELLDEAVPCVSHRSMRWLWPVILAAGRTTTACCRQRQPTPNHEPSEEQKQWAAAQQIGQHLKDVLLERLGINPETARGLAGATLVNLFAPRLLLPADWFAADAAALDYDVFQLKERYPNCTHEITRLRLGWTCRSHALFDFILDNDHIHRRRSNAWPVRRKLEPAEEQCQRYVNHYSRPRVVRVDNWTVQGWPVHSVDWKREILRSVVES